ncbi:Hypothetical predicted protein [Paramuricea clavata]|uniref:Uncharacterized protein n=1 Tax=Paramuricea clavata TaxID=317549 RepID=A0A7D9DPH3_PARCT|nr:Hypothetical predicted protein [Paramuricea clavata]
MSKPSWCLLAAFVIIFQQIAPIVSQTADKLVPRTTGLTKSTLPPKVPRLISLSENFSCQEPRDPTGSGSGPISTTPSLMVGKSITSSGQRSTLPPKGTFYASYGKILFSHDWIGDLHVS